MPTTAQQTGTIHIRHLFMSRTPVNQICNLGKCHAWQFQLPDNHSLHIHISSIVYGMRRDRLYQGNNIQNIRHKQPGKETGRKNTATIHYEQKAINITKGVKSNEQQHINAFENIIFQFTTCKIQELLWILQKLHADKQIQSINLQHKYKRRYQST